MLKISNLIYETCKTYMKQQAKLLLLLEIFIAACIFYYFFDFNATPLPKVLTILGWSILGILGSFAVAWFGMRINTYAKLRTAFLFCGPIRVFGDEPAAALGNVYRRFADLRRVDYDDYHSAVCAERKRRCLLYRFCHRRIPGRIGIAHLRRYLYEGLPISVPI